MVPFKSLEYGFLFAFHSNYGLILYHFRNKARYWSKIAIFHTFPAFDTLLWGSHQNIAIRFATETLERCGYLMVISLFVSTRYTNVIEGQTDAARTTA